MNNTQEAKEARIITHLTLKDIEERFAHPISEEEAPEIIEKIKQGTALQGDYVVVPPFGSAEFELFQVDKGDSEDLKNKMAQVFGDESENVIVLSEEESIGPGGLTQFSKDDFLNNVVSYLREWGQNTNYWAYDGKTTVTFHRAEVAFWKKPINQGQPTSRPN